MCWRGGRLAGLMNTPPTAGICMDTAGDTSNTTTVATFISLAPPQQTQLGNCVQSKSFEFSFLPNSSNGMSYLSLRIFPVGDPSSVSSCQDPGQWLHPLCIRHGRGQPGCGEVRPRHLIVLSSRSINQFCGLYIICNSDRVNSFYCSWNQVSN